MGESSGEREVLDWATYGVAARALAQQVADDGYDADIVLAIARGGLFAAGSLGYPDLGITGLEDVLIDVRRIVDAHGDPTPVHRQARPWREQRPAGDPGVIAARIGHLPRLKGLTQQQVVVQLSSSQ